MILHGIRIAEDTIADFCRRNRIVRLSVLGSILRKDFRPESDIDVLVQFEPSHRVGLFTLTSLEMELSDLLGRKVDLNTSGFLSPDFRDQVLAEAIPLYAAA
jgi:hypothetical protein